MEYGMFERATLLALEAHSGAKRRGKNSPYILHLMEAAAVVETMSDDPALLSAAMLHDLIEDTGYSIDDVRREFGERVALLVAAESDPVFEDLTIEESWHLRKQESINRLAASHRDAKIVAMGDKLSNIRAIARDYALLGDEIWQRFHTSDPKEHAWHYRGLAAALAELSDTAAYREFVRLVEEVFGPEKQE